MMLIQIKPSMVVSTAEIKRAYRCGNYTDIEYLDGRMLDQIWDEEEVVWNQIVKATKEQFK